MFMKGKKSNSRIMTLVSNNMSFIQSFTQDVTFKKQLPNLVTQTMQDSSLKPVRGLEF